MDEHPGVVFREGPTGRRAALAGGPDVWEVIATVKGVKGSGDPFAAAARILDLTKSQVGVAVGYFDAFPEEVDDRIACNVADADQAEAAWRRDHPALA